MGPCEDRSTAGKNQAGHGHTAGPGRRARHPRRRACLLKGCERRFRPVHPLTRYCSQECREQAGRWRAWKARHRYRQSEAGKQKRRAQSRRYRMRCQQTGAAQPAPGKPREGHRKKNYFASAVTARAATRSSCATDARRCSDFARGCVAELWSGLWSENDAGGNGSGSGSSHGAAARGV